MKTNVVVPRFDTWAGLSVRTAGARENPTQVVVFMHGWGASGDDLVPLSQVLPAPGRLFVFPEAPLVTFGGGRAWWNLDLAAIEAARLRGDDRDLREEVPKGLPEVRATVLALLREIATRTNVPLSSIVVGGFSQGAMVATDAMLAAEEKPGALVILSGTMVAEAHWRKAMAHLPRKYPVFISHGRGDVVLPFRLAEHLAQALASCSDEVTWLPFDGGHEIPHEVIDGVSAFLSAVSK
ncbi:MAG: esterase [Deltaproteobacteria bacterium]|nr:esterase [Deltaproteobacteria bacterium]